MFFAVINYYNVFFSIQLFDHCQLKKSPVPVADDLISQHNFPNVSEKKNLPASYYTNLNKHQLNFFLHVQSSDSTSNSALIFIHSARLP